MGLVIRYEVRHLCCVWLGLMTRILVDYSPILSVIPVCEGAQVAAILRPRSNVEVRWVVVFPCKVVVGMGVDFVVLDEEVEHATQAYLF